VAVRRSSRDLDRNAIRSSCRAGSWRSDGLAGCSRHEAHGPNVVVSVDSLESDVSGETAEDEGASCSAESGDVTAGTETRVNGCTNRAPLSPFGGG
jgi:hypothetical protein